MPGLLIEHAEVLVTMDSDRREIADAAIFTDDRQILFVGTSKEVRKWILDQGENVCFSFSVWMSVLLIVCVSVSLCVCLSVVCLFLVFV